METPTNVESLIAPESDLDEIIGELDVGYHELPVEAIRAAQKHRDLIAPRLIEVIRTATADARAGNLPDGQSHFFALFLLAEFHATEAWPAIFEAISLPDELPFDLFGDAITSTLARILVVMIGDRLDELVNLIRNRELNEYVRWEAAQTFVYLVAENRLSREEAVRRLRLHLREAIENRDYDITGPLVGVLADLVGREALDDIQEAFRLDLVDEGLVGLKHVERDMSASDSEYLERLKWYANGPIVDTIAELESWASFTKDKRERVEDEFDDDFEDDSFLRQSPSFVAQPFLPRSPLAFGPASLPLPLAESITVKHSAPRIGRNDPCPCGSGKKYKKCCGGPK